jgi:hypothetical protein
VYVGDGRDSLECQADHADVSVVWHDEDGSLRGWVEVRNVGDRPCRLSGKPSITPLSADGSRLDAPTIVTAELKLPGYVVLEPGQRARAAIGWGAWDGPTAGVQVVVGWEGQEKQVTVSGPTQPSRSEGPTNIWSYWFELVS